MNNEHLFEVVDQIRQVVREPLTDGELMGLFISRGSDGAFQALVERYGSMVLGVCRRWLGAIHDAEDAFQAVFFVLSRKAATIRPPDAVGRWLYGVAVRTARKAKIRRDRQRKRQILGSANFADLATVSSEPNDWWPLLDKELNRLPEKYRRPLVLCDLLCRSRRSAAMELGIAEGTLSSRLARAREKLRLRLIRRGVIPSLAASAIASAGSGDAVMPPSLYASTTHACCDLAFDSMSNSARAIAEKVLHSMFITKLRSTVILSCLAAAILGLGWRYHSVLFAEPALPSTKADQANSVEKPPEKPKENKGAKTSRLTELRQERVKALAEVVRMMELRLAVGEGAESPRLLIDARLKLLHAEVELATTKEERLKLYEAMLKQMKNMEDKITQMFKAGQVRSSEVSQAKAARLEIEILLEQAKGQ